MQNKQDISFEESYELAGFDAILVCTGNKASHNGVKACGCSRQAPSVYRLRLVSVLGRRAGTTPSTGTCCRNERIQAASARTFYPVAPWGFEGTKGLLAFVLCRE